MAILIMKFGGSCVGTTTALTQLLSIVLHEQDQWENMILVVSALDGVTDVLIEAAHLAKLGNQRGYRRIIATMRHRHMALIEELPMGNTERTALLADIDRLLFDMLDIYQSMGEADDDNQRLPDSVDETIGVGERMSARIVAALLRQNNLRSVAIDTTDLIITDDIHGQASPNIPLTSERITQNLLPMLERGIVPVVTGFIGATPTGKPTTLGRGGTDYTASILGACSRAKEIWIWTDVDGMMSADPRETREARVIQSLSYDEAGEMAYFGARILHPRMVFPVREAGIPVRVKNIYRPQQPGTSIQEIAPARHPLLKAVTAINGLGLSANHNGSLSPIAALVDEIMFETTHTHADVMIASQSSRRSFVCFLIPTTAGPDAVHTTRIALEERLLDDSLAQEWTIQPVVIVTAVGTKLDEVSTVVAGIYQSMIGIRVLALAQSPSHSGISLVVLPEDADEALRRIHQLVVNTG